MIICLCSQSSCNLIAEIGLPVEACFVETEIVLLELTILAFGKRIGVTKDCFGDA